MARVARISRRRSHIDCFLVHSETAVVGSTQIQHSAPSRNRTPAPVLHARLDIDVDLVMKVSAVSAPIDHFAAEIAITADR